MEGERTLAGLQQLQALPLSLKVKMTQQRIRDWVDYYGEDGVFVSFSGGKDSTVLLHLVREMYPGVPAVFFDTGLELPEIRSFAKGFDNVEFVKPGKTFKEIIKTDGYPMISKGSSKQISVAKRVFNELYEEYVNGGGTLTRKEYLHSDIIKQSAAGIQKKKGAGRLCRLIGIIDKTGKVNPQLEGKDRSSYCDTRWMDILLAPFDTTDRCCYHLKKYPSEVYSKRTGRVPILATMASESRLRAAAWVKLGCNAFDNGEHTRSTPMSFWVTQDVLMYVKMHDIPICSAYGDVVTEEDGFEYGSSFYDMDGGIFDLCRPTYKTTGFTRTGCMFCGYGTHLEKPGEGRFTRLKETHPKQYDYIMRPLEEGGLGYKAVIDWINENMGTHIEY